MNLDPKKISAKFNPSLRPFCLAERGIYSQKPNNHDPGEVGGANAPPNSPRLPGKRGYCRVSAARVWPGGHTLLVGLPGFSL